MYSKIFIRPLSDKNMVKKVKKKECEIIEAEMKKDLNLESPQNEEVDNKGLCYIG